VGTDAPLSWLRVPGEAATLATEPLPILQISANKQVHFGYTSARTRLQIGQLRSNSRHTKRKKKPRKTQLSLEIRCLKRFERVPSPLNSPAKPADNELRTDHNPLPLLLSSDPPFAVTQFRNHAAMCSIIGGRYPGNALTLQANPARNTAPTSLTICPQPAAKPAISTYQNDNNPPQTRCNSANK
jgi:hypothetical protein